MQVVVVLVLSIIGSVWGTNYPDFSWDTLPLFQHNGNSSGPYSPSVISYLAQFPLLTVEKMACMQCEPANHKQEDKILAALKSVKAVNPRQKSMAYLNTILNFPQYDLYDQVMADPSLLLHNSSGQIAELNIRGSTWTVFDHSNPKMRALWLNTSNYFLSHGADGIFADRGRSSAEVDLAKISLSPEKRKAWDEGHLLVMLELQEQITNKTGGFAILNGRDEPGVLGRMFEDFSVNDVHAVPPGDDLPVLMNETSNGPRVAEVHADKCPSGPSLLFNTTITSFLIGAGEYSYYGCTEGWRTDAGWLEVRPEYLERLGAPTSHATGNVKDGVHYWSRSFASGTTVHMQASWEKPCIQWASGRITGLQEDCDWYE